MCVHRSHAHYPQCTHGREGGREVGGREDTLWGESRREGGESKDTMYMYRHT